MTIELIRTLRRDFGVHGEDGIRWTHVRLFRRPEDDRYFLVEEVLDVDFDSTVHRVEVFASEETGAILSYDALAKLEERGGCRVPQERILAALAEIA